MRSDIEAESSGFGSHERNSLASKQGPHLGDDSTEPLVGITEGNIVESLGKLAGAGTESENKPSTGECVER